MAASKRKKKRKTPVARTRDAIPTSQQSNGKHAVPLHQREDRHKLVAMTLASLVAGLVLIVNLDRTTHVASLSQDQRMVMTSWHGWPKVFLERKLPEVPVVYFARRIYSWPWPAVESELRQWNLANLGIDVAAGVAIVVASYWLVRFLVLHYDRWKVKYFQ